MEKIKVARTNYNNLVTAANDRMQAVMAAVSNAGIPAAVSLPILRDILSLTGKLTQLLEDCEPYEGRTRTKLDDAVADPRSAEEIAADAAAGLT